MNQKVLLSIFDSFLKLLLFVISKFMIFMDTTNHTNDAKYHKMLS